MRKILLFPLLLLLVACAPEGEALSESKLNTESASPTAVTDAPPEGAPSDSASEQPLDNAITIGMNPAEAGVVRERDWTIGAEDPLVTIIEYGDFQ